MARYAPDVVAAALVSRGVPEHVARGVVMNFQDESGLDTGIQETTPNAHGTRGFGIAQWTDSRRIALEDFARSQGKPIDDLDTQMDFFMQENAGPEAGAWKSVVNQPTTQDAAAAFVRDWERPATVHKNARMAKYAAAGNDAWMGTGGAAGGQGVHPPNPTVTSDGKPAVTQPQRGIPVPIAPKPEQSPFAKAMEGLGGGLGDMGAAPAAAPLQTNQAAAAPSIQMPSQSIINPDAANAQRQQLAEVMARLNSG